MFGFSILIKQFLFKRFISSLLIISYIFGFLLAPLTAQANVVATQTIEDAVTPDFATKTYITQQGDSLASLAKAYNLKLDALFALNKHQRFAVGINEPLPQGSSVILPEDPLTRAQSQHFSQQIALASKNFNDKKQNDQTKAKTPLDTTINNGLTKTANILSKNKDLSQIKDAVSSEVKNTLTQGANQTLGSWLSYYGTSNIRLNLENGFHFGDSGIDILFPLYDQISDIIFTQASFSRMSERMQANIGIGNRYFIKNYMIGVNSFFDYDFTGGHARIGFGSEYWRDYLHVGANVYLGLTGWQASELIKNGIFYRERAANGFDVAAEAYWPQHPAWGLNLKFEQYFGDEVALVSQDKRGKNPSSLGLGVSYTPIPLVSLNAAYRYTSIGQSGRLGLDVTYRFGVPFEAQTDFGAVDVLRRLQGSRYDLVERNNNIVLEYQAALLNIVVLPEIKGKAGSQHHVFVIAEVGQDWKPSWAHPEELTLSNDCQSLSSLGQCQVTLPDKKVAQEQHYPLSLTLSHIRTGKEKVYNTEVVLEADGPVIQASEEIIANKEENADPQLIFEQIDIADPWILDDWILPEDFTQNKGSLSEECYEKSTIHLCKVNFPHYNGKGEIQNYTLQLNLKNPVTSQAQQHNIVIGVGPQRFNLEETSLTADNKLIPIKGKAKLTVKLVTIDGQLFDIPQETIASRLHFVLGSQHKTETQQIKEEGLASKASSIMPKEASFSPITKESPGIYSVEFLAGEVEAIHNIKVKYYNATLKSLTIDVMDPAISAENSQFLLKPKVIHLNQKAKLTFVARSPSNRPLKGIADRIKFEIKHEADLPFEPVTVEEDTDPTKEGYYHGYFEGGSYATYFITPSVKVRPNHEAWTTLEKFKKELIVRPASLDEEKSSLFPEKKELVAQGELEADKEQEVKLHLLAIDKNGAPILGLEGKLLLNVRHGDSENILETVALTKGEKDGEYIGHFGILKEGKYRDSGAYTFTVFESDMEYDKLKAVVTINKDNLAIDPALSALTLKDKKLINSHKGGRSGEFSAKVTMKGGRVLPLSDLRIRLFDAQGKEAPQAAEIKFASEEEKNGVYRHQISAKAEGEYKLVLEYKDIAGTYNEVDRKDIIFISDLPSETYSKFTPSQELIAINDSAAFPAEAVFTFEAYDNYQEPINYADLLTTENYKTALKLAVKQDKKEFTKVAALYDSGNKFIATIKGSLHKDWKRVGEFAFVPVYDKTQLKDLEKNLTISYEHALPDKVVVKPETLALDLASNEFYGTVNLELYVEDHLQKNTNDRIVHKLYRITGEEEEDLQSQMLEPIPTSNPGVTASVGFRPKEEGNYVIRNYYRSYADPEELILLKGETKVKVSDYSKDLSYAYSQMSLNRYYFQVPDEENDTKSDETVICTLNMRNGANKPFLIEDLSKIKLLVYYQLNLAKKKTLIETLDFMPTKEEATYQSEFPLKKDGQYRDIATYELVVSYEGEEIRKFSQKFSLEKLKDPKKPMLTSEAWHNGVWGMPVDDYLNAIRVCLNGPFKVPDESLRLRAYRDDNELIGEDYFAEQWPCRDIRGVRSFYGKKLTYQLVKVHDDKSEEYLATLSGLFPDVQHADKRLSTFTIDKNEAVADASSGYPSSVNVEVSLIDKYGLPIDLEIMATKLYVYHYNPREIGYYYWRPPMKKVGTNNYKGVLNVGADPGGRTPPEGPVEWKLYASDEEYHTRVVSLGGPSVIINVSYQNVVPDRIYPGKITIKKNKPTDVAFEFYFKNVLQKQGLQQITAYVQKDDRIIADNLQGRVADNKVFFNLNLDEGEYKIGFRYRRFDNGRPAIVYPEVMCEAKTL